MVHALAHTVFAKNNTLEKEANTPLISISAADAEHRVVPGSRCASSCLPALSAARILRRQFGLMMEDGSRVRLDARRGDLRARPHREGDLRLLAVVDGEALEEQAAETRPSAAAAPAATTRRARNHAT